MFPVELTSDYRRDGEERQTSSTSSMIRINRWLVDTYEHLLRLSESTELAERCGIQRVNGYRYVSSESALFLPEVAELFDLRKLSSEEVSKLLGRKGTEGDSELCKDNHRNPSVQSVQSATAKLNENGASASSTKPSRFSTSGLNGANTDGCTCMSACARPSSTVSRTVQNTNIDVAAHASRPDSRSTSSTSFPSSRTLSYIAACNADDKNDEEEDDTSMTTCVGSMSASRSSSPSIFTPSAVYASKALAVDGKKYLPFLAEWFRRLGGLMEKRKVHRLTELVGYYDVIVNCSGLGARDLVGDKEVYPIRGQIVVARASSWLRPAVHLYHEGSDVRYVIPRPHGGGGGEGEGGVVLLLGGTSEPDNWSTVPDPMASKRIYDKCVGMVPELEMAGVEVIGSWACLRPARVSGVRVEVEYVMMGDEGRGRGRGKGRERGEEGRRGEEEIKRRGEGGKESAGYRSSPVSVPVVHGYGHGGQGVLSSWGCALELAGMVAECCCQLKGQDEKKEKEKKKEKILEKARQLPLPHSDTVSWNTCPPQVHVVPVAKL